MSEKYVTETEQGAIIAVRAQPRSSRAGIDGVFGDGEAVRVRIRCAPVDGKANRELIEVLADEFNLAKSSVRFVSGETSKNKRLLLCGVKAERVSEVVKGGG